ncbi:MAG TPA: hypothetical protein VNU47_03320 [Candidatus Paceibacterota bacterium]|nr:hypothetical protein [Candidatus Paceibacterota bacterium]
MHITKPRGYDQFIAHFDPIGLTGLGTSRDDTRALLWALANGDLARKFQVTNARLSWLIAAVEQYKQLRSSSSWTVKMEVIQRLLDSEPFQRLLSYGLNDDEHRRITTTGMRALQAHRALQLPGRLSKSPSSLKRRRRKMYQEFTRVAMYAVESGIRVFGTRIRK